MGCRRSITVNFNRSEASMDEIVFKVPDITCMDCVSHIARRIKQLPGAQKISGNPTSKTVRVFYDPSRVQPPQIAEAIGKAGYTVESSGQ